MMRRLIVNNAAPLRRVKFHLVPWPVHKIGKIKGRDLSQRAEAICRDQLRGLLHRFVETVTWPNNQDGPSCLGGIDHRVALGELEGHRLFDKDMLSGLRSGNALFGMQAMRGRDINGIDSRSRQQSLETIIAKAIELSGETLAGFGSDIECAHQLNPWVRTQSRKRQHESPAEANNA